MDRDWRTDPAPIGTVAEILVEETSGEAVKERCEELYGQTVIGTAVEVDPAPGFEVIPRFGQWWKVEGLPLIRSRHWRPVESSQLELGI